jgi:hypothetical protein
VFCSCNSYDEVEQLVKNNKKNFFSSIVYSNEDFSVTKIGKRLDETLKNGIYYCNIFK